MAMKLNKKPIKITVAIALLVGITFFGLISTTISTSFLQSGLLGFLIGFFIIWLVYFAVWFIVKGFKRTAFPVQSAYIVTFLKKFLYTTVTTDQEKMLIELAGTVIMIAAGLLFAGWELDPPGCSQCRSR